eukprot:7708715-Pyramimonas_sp.AAC.1
MRPDGPKRRPDGSKRPPRGPQKAPQKAPKRPQEDPRGTHIHSCCPRCLTICLDLSPPSALMGIASGWDGGGTSLIATVATHRTASSQRAANEQRAKLAPQQQERSTLPLRRRNRRWRTGGSS